ncbi:Hypothetical protein POVR1_LOCUS422 [uncultured virus]|nr:Hypothetical protein POVR1_LOCUS422 [uncultured virus]
MDRRLRKISGPVAYTSFNLLGHKLHIFGDRHDKLTLCDKCSLDCLYIPDLLQYIVERAVDEREQIDIFLEIPFQIEGVWNRKTVDTVLYDVLDQFPNCFTYDKSQCKYLPYVRFHYADIRQHMKHSSILPNLLTILIDVRAREFDNDVRPYYYTIEKIEWFFKHHPWMIFDIYIGKNDGKSLLESAIKHFDFDYVFRILSPEFFQTFKKGMKIHKIRYSLLQLEPWQAKPANLIPVDGN